MVNNENQRQFGTTLFVLDLHIHRQGGLEWGIVIAAHAKTAGATHRYQPAAQVAHVGLQGEHLIPAKLPRRDIYQQHRVVLRQRRQMRGQVSGRGLFHRKAGRL